MTPTQPPAQMHEAPQTGSLFANLQLPCTWSEFPQESSSLSLRCDPVTTLRSRPEKPRVQSRGCARHECRGRGARPSAAASSAAGAGNSIQTPAPPSRPPRVAPSFLLHKVPAPPAGGTIQVRRGEEGRPAWGQRRVRGPGPGCAHRGPGEAARRGFLLRGAPGEGASRLLTAVPTGEGEWREKKNL
ncbi:translation initiation factor IF-2-like isoform X1 [Gallus gallus]|uniref:translation initiation factor IF-2-like isoform X1 n=1 Tax=Gallus gallus TaxID=9031 RepID=UPI001EFFF19F|nr:translation initiation factor IF-2-like isoform X1 [Gallus gallus]